jgi:hypothetical protein
VVVSGELHLILTGTEVSILELLIQNRAGDKIEKNEVGGVCRMCGGRRVERVVLVEKPEGKRPLGKPRHRWEDIIKMDLQEVGCGVMDWIELAQGRESWRALVSVVMNLWVPFLD